jgi:two-component system LytT family response regulator
MTTSAPAFRVIIVDDEPVARQRLRRLLGAEPGLEIVAECEDGASAVAAITQHEADLVLLDVQMPGLDGFGVLAALPSDRLPLVVFVTAYDEHALRAFDVHALDYVLKPIDPARLHLAVVRARDLHARLSAAERRERTFASLAAAPAANRFLVKTNGRMFFVNTADVDWIEADGNYVHLHVGAASHMIRDTIAAVERSLPVGQFARIHRSAIVNVDRVREMRQWSSGDYIVVLTTGTKLKLSRTYRDRIEAVCR